MNRREAYGVLCMVYREMGVHWRVHTAKAYAMYFYIDVAVPWPTKWGRRA